MKIFYVFRMNGIENYPATGEFFLENVILKGSQTHFSKVSYPKGGGGGLLTVLSTLYGLQKIYFILTKGRTVDYSLERK